MDPESGTRRPEMQSTVVVFPAPFGPMTPKISPPDGQAHVADG
jgi:hypothetical protein